MKKSKVTVLLVGLLFLSLIGCMSYKKISVGNAEPFTNHDIRENFQNYNIYIHEENGVYELQNPEIGEKLIAGTPKKITNQQLINEITDTNNVKGKDINKYNLTIHTKKPLIENDGVAQSGDEIILDYNPTKRIEIKADDIEKVEMYANDEKVVGIIALYIILCFIALGLLIWLMIVLLNQAGNSSSNASANSSGNSNSNSGGSNSGGSCYVATMVYGSYDAPEVLVLRRFRDNFLQKFYLGRMFIKTYYKYSPHFVKKFQHNENIHKPIRFMLNQFIKFLSN
jgi:uncharacterized membrane protein